MSRVLITGIEGFVGRHLCRHLVELRHEVHGIHFAAAGDGIDADLHKGDVRHFPWLRAEVADIRPDVVIHLAAVSSVAESETHVIETFEVNATGTLNVIESVRLSGPGIRLLLVSTADVYGRAVADDPLTEEVPPRPFSPYALSKIAAEEAGRFSHRAFGTDVVILRPFSHTGPGQSHRFVFPTVARKIARIEKAWEANPGLDLPSRTIGLGNLEVRRDYTDVRDIVRAYGLALESCRAGETYNVTSSHPVLLREAIETLCGMARCEIRYVSTAERRRARDLPVLTGNCAKFSAETGWKPEIDFRTTLADLLDYWRSQV